MEWANSSRGDGFCDTECMTPDWGYDTASQYSNESQKHSDYFELYSDCWTNCQMAGCPSGWAGDIYYCDTPQCFNVNWGYGLGDCGKACNSSCDISSIGDGFCD